MIIEEISRSGNELTLVPTRGSPCGGDSGGPMFARLATGDLRLVGVHSRSFGGCPNEQVVASTPGGFVFDGIGTGSLMDVLSLQDGDVPLTVNGYDVATIEDVLTARTALDSATFLTVVVQRGSSTATLKYSIG